MGLEHLAQKKIVTLLEKAYSLSGGESDIRTSSSEHVHDILELYMAPVPWRHESQ
jgi:hypothetical protein